MKKIRLYFNFMSRDWPFDLLKFLRIMKITCFLLLISALSVFAGKTYSQTKMFNLNMENVRVKAVLSSIEDQSEFYFFYSDKIIDVNRNVSISAENQNIETVLKSLFTGTDVAYVVKDRIIVLTTPEVSQAESQQRAITGTVTDEADLPLPGVTVLVKGTTQGTLTNTDGKYSISNVPENATLVFSFVGMKSQEFAVLGKTGIDVKMQEEAIVIDEVVAIGYGTKKRGELTGAVSKINSEAFSSKPITGALSALQGIVPGVTISRTGGQPGQEDYEIKIRGVSSINGNKPLILIDGIPGDINSINPADIADISVLKDASSAIYGARAADGVMLITTKSGNKTEKVDVSYSYNIGFKTPSYMKKVSTTYESIAMFDDGRSNDGDPIKFNADDFAKILANQPGAGPGKMLYLEGYPMFYQSTDYIGAIFKNSQIQNHNLNLSGGGQKMRYLVSFGYLDNSGNINYGTNYSKRYNVKTSLQFDISSKIKLDVRLGYDFQRIREPSMLGEALNGASNSWSYMPIRNPAGNYYQYQGFGNPMSYLEEGGDSKSEKSSFTSNFKLDVQLFDDLVFTSQAGLYVMNADQDAYYRTFITYDWDNIAFGSRNNPNSANYSYSKNKYQNFNNYLNYNKTFNAHKVGAMIGTSYEFSDLHKIYMSGQNFVGNELFTLNLSDPNGLRTGPSGSWDMSDWALLSYFARFSYSYNMKYLIDATFRKDGSSKFAPDRRWSATFPSVSAGWRISEEGFMKEIPKKYLSDLKIRASWGKTGNQDISSLGLYDYLPLIDITGAYPMDYSNPSKSAVMKGMASKTRTWETIEKTNLGIDFGLFNSKLIASFDIYKKVNSDMLVPVLYPATLGAVAPTTNVGRLDIKGWELNMNWKDNIGEFRYNVGFVINYNENLLTDLKGQNYFSPGYTAFREGYPINSYYGYKSDGIIKTLEQLKTYSAKFAGKGIIPSVSSDYNGYHTLGIGDLMYKDLNSDGKITPYGDNTPNGDAVFLGSEIPKFEYSVSANAMYKGFDFGIIVQGTGNKYAFRSGTHGFAYNQPWWPPYEYFYNKTFTQGNTPNYAENLNAKYPRLSHDGNIKGNNMAPSDVYVENTKYARLKNLTVGYNIPKRLINKWNIEKVRVYFSGQDLFTIAKGTRGGMYDPEESGQMNNANEQVYPFYRTYSFGLDVAF